MTTIKTEPLEGGAFHINGLRIDPQPIADGLYEIICNAGEESIVAFGMIPLWVMEMFEKNLRAKVIAEAARQIGCTVEELTPFLDQAKLKATTEPIIHAVSVGIYRAASNAGMMIV